MTISELGSIGEFVSAIAVVASLIFVGFELRRSDRTQRVASLQTVMDGCRDRTLMPAFKSAELVDLVARGLTSFEDLSATERRRFNYYMIEQTFQMQKAMELHNHGLMPKIDYDAWLFYTASMVKCPGGLAVWPYMVTTVTPTVVDLINSYLANNPELPTYLELNPLFDAASGENLPSPFSA